MDNLDFSIDLPVADPHKLLHQAINEINSLSAHLGNGVQDVQTSGAQVLAKIMDDAVLLPNLPVLHKITDEGFLHKEFDLPIDVQQLLEKNNFYWLQVPVGIFTKENWTYSRIEVGLAMSVTPGDDIPRAYRILPDKEFQQLFEFNTEGQLSLDSSFNFSGKTANYNFNYKGNELHVDAAAGAAAGVKTKIVYGPLSFKIRKTLIDYAGKNMHMIKWVLDDTQKIQDGFDLVSIIQVPKSYAHKHFSISAEVRARRKLSDFGDLTGLFQFLSQTVKDFFKTGCPVRDVKEWDLGQYL